jgi:hypothetical protein
VSSDEGIAAFLAARLDEDEATAKAAPGNDWRADKDGCCVLSESDAVAETSCQAPSWPDERRPAVEHIARHDPARTLREVAAKREILEWHYRSLPPMDAPEGLEICIGEEGDGDTWEMATPWPCPQIRALAAIWSDNPDYQPEWKPLTAAEPPPP